MEEAIICLQCKQILFKVVDGNVRVATKLSAKRTSYLTSHGGKVEVEVKCPRCEGITTLYFSER